MESSTFQIDTSSLEPHYECNNGKIWTKTVNESDLLFKFYDFSVKEEKEPKKIKDE